jgi:hypothetical protein
MSRMQNMVRFDDLGLYKEMKRCKRRCLTLAISQGKIGELGDGDSRRKYCAICEIYFGLCVEVTRCPCCSNILRCPLKIS